MYIYTRRERARAAFLHKSIVVRSDGCKRESIQDGEINVLEKKTKKMVSSAKCTFLWLTAKSFYRMVTSPLRLLFEMERRISSYRSFTLSFTIISITLGE